LFNSGTPLHHAAKKGHLEVVEYLLNQKCEINMKNQDGKTPLTVARQSLNFKIVEFLKSKGGIEYR